MTFLLFLKKWFKACNFIPYVIENEMYLFKCLQILIELTVLWLSHTITFHQRLNEYLIVVQSFNIWAFKSQNLIEIVLSA